MGAEGGTLTGRVAALASQRSRGVRGKQEGARGTRCLLLGFLYPLRWGWLPQAETLLRWAVPRPGPQQLGTLRGSTRALFLSPSPLTVMTRTLDSPGRHQASNLFSPPPPTPLRPGSSVSRGGLEGVDLPWGLGPLREAPKPGTANFHSPAAVLMLAGEGLGQGGGGCPQPC